MNTDSPAISPQQMDTSHLPRLLVFELRLMGDAVMSLPFIRAAQARFEVHVCCSPAAEPIFRMVLPHTQVHRWHPPWLAAQDSRFAPLANIAALRDMAGQLKALQATHAVCSWCDPRTGLLMSWTGVPSRIGFASHRDNFYGRHLAWRRRQLVIARAIETIVQLASRRPLLTQALRRRDYGQHHVEDWRQIADTLGLEFDTTQPWLHGAGPPSATRASSACYDPADATAVQDTRRRPRIAIHPGASEAQKRWPLSHFLRLGHVLAEHYEVSFIEPPELGLDEAVRRHFPVIATASLAELAAYLGGIDVLIGNDAGVGHLAAARGLPVIAIFLSSDARHFAPYTSRELVISFDGACAVRPCFGRCTQPALLCHLPADYETVASRVTASLARLLP